MAKSKLKKKRRSLPPSSSSSAEPAEVRPYEGDPPMPEVARHALTDALGLPPSLEPTAPADPATAPLEPPPMTEPPATGHAEEAAPPVLEEEPRRRRRHGGKHRTKSDLMAENRELRDRLKSLPPPPPPPPPAPVDPTEARGLATRLLQFIFRAYSVKHGPHWVLPEEEAEPIGRHLGDGIAPYLPNLGAALPWLLGGMGLVNAIQSRLEQDNAAETARPPTPPQAPPIVDIQPEAGEGEL